MFILINKPKGITSHDVVQRVREITGERRIGHAGTLDPNATGLLIIGVGRDATKNLWRIAKNQKTYVAEICLGEERDTDDVEGEVISTSPSISPDIKNIEKTLRAFVGEQKQVPPAFSAIKIKGEKAYEMARKGQEVKLRPRKVVIHSIKVLNYEYLSLKIETEVSSGTYIRALARDIGRKLGCGAYLKNLQRTRVGKFDIKEAVYLEDLSRTTWKKSAVHFNTI